MLRRACDGVLAVLEGARAAGFGGRIVWIGSALAIDRTGGTRAPHFRGAVKAAESLLAAQLAAQLGLALSEVRVFTGYGPFEQAQRLVPSLLRAALSGTRVPLAATPAHRDWIHYEDIARLCLAVASAPSPHAGPVTRTTPPPTGGPTRRSMRRARRRPVGGRSSSPSSCSTSPR